MRVWLVQITMRTPPKQVTPICRRVRQMVSTRRTITAAYLVRKVTSTLAMMVRGTSAMVGAADAHNGHPFPGHDLPDYTIDRAQRTFLYSRAHTIYGGSNQVQRNVIGERVLGLPREPRGT